MKITIIYDNEAAEVGLRADWGFSCLVEAYNKRILFDTGANGTLLLENMKKLNIDPTMIDEVFISHAHWDHMGGLSDFLLINPIKVYIPSSCPEPHGELKNREQSLVAKMEKGLVVIVGCSHPGVKNILEAASQFGEAWALIGGLHGFREFDAVRDLEVICPTHCTQFKSEIKTLYPEKYIKGGAGKVIEI